MEQNSYLTLLCTTCNASIQMSDSKIVEHC